MSPAEVVFWVAAAFVVYPYLVYPHAVGLLARLFARPVRRRKGHRPTVSFVTCAHNEALSIDKRLRELTGVLAATGIRGEILVVSDGSTDETAALVRRYADHNVRLLELRHR